MPGHWCPVTARAFGHTTAVITPRYPVRVSEEVGVSLSVADTSQSSKPVQSRAKACLSSSSFQDSLCQGKASLSNSFRSKNICAFLSFLFPFFSMLIVPSVHFTHLFHSFVHLSRAKPCVVGSPLAVWVTKHQPELWSFATHSRLPSLRVSPPS